MIKKNQKSFASIINKSPTFKKYLLYLIDFYYDLRPFLCGYLLRNFAYIRNLLNSKIISKPGTLSFKGGAFNPGALLLDEGNVLLIAKSQLFPWYKARGNKKKYYLEGSPVIFLLEKKSLETRESYILNNLVGFPTNEDFAIEDFRVFQWKGSKMLNHSFVVKGEIDGFINQVEVRSVLSILDEKEKKITFCSFPKLDFPIQKFEKNWVYKENGEQLLLFYSLNPYKVLALENEEVFRFETLINQDFGTTLTNPGGFGTRVSYSTNPIDFDANYWFLVIHQIDYKLFGRCYYHWGLLIDKYSFLPVKITSKPIFSGMGARGRLPGIRYISSVLRIENDLLFFAGEGDIYITVTKKTVGELNALFVGI